MHLEDFFNEGDTPNGDVLVFLGGVLKEMWEARLQREFPEKQFEVQFHVDVELDEYVVSFHQRLRNR